MSADLPKPTHTQEIFPHVRNGDLAAIEGLLDADPMLIHARESESEENHRTALGLAASCGNLAVCRLLVDRGAEVYTNPMSTYPPVMLAAWNKHQEVVDYFLQEIPDRADGTNGLGVAINLAGRMGWSEIVRKHIEIDPLSVHQRGWIGDTPLHWPSHNGFIEIVRMLLDHGADPKAHEINWIGGTPLHWASERNPRIVQLLIDAGAEVDARVVRPGSSHFGGTPLHWCARQRDDCAEAIEVLLRSGARADLIDAVGKTALEYAVEGGHARVAATLRGHSPDMAS